MHVNLPNNCPGCEVIIERYPGFHVGLAAWVRDVRTRHPEAHISAAGRNQQDQEVDFAKGVSKAHWLQSAHNYNAAVDFFRLTLVSGASFDAPWYWSVLAAEVQIVDWLTWGGSFTTIVDLPHVEVSNWKSLAAQGSLKPVE